MHPSLATDIYRAINSKREFPHLHRVYRDRHLGGVRKFSRCSDTFLVKRTKELKGEPVYARTDSREFQMNAKFNEFPFIGMDWNRRDREEGMRNFLIECCPIMTERFIIYGIIGRGSEYPCGI
jgi:hypothetical protein